MIRIAFGSVLLALCQACSHVSQCPVELEQVDGPRYVLLEGLGDCAGGPLDNGLGDLVATEREAFKTRLGARKCPVSSRKQAQEVFGQATHRPLVAIYSGHGVCSAYEQNSNKSRCANGARSELCFADGKVAVETLIKRIPASVPYAMVVLNACFSANVDLRESAVPLSVLSASPSFVKAEGATVLGPELLHALGGASDYNEDGRIDDDELLRFVALESERRRPAEARRQGVLLAKLRRQAWAPIPFMTWDLARSEAALAKIEALLRDAEPDEATVRALMERERELAVRPSARVLWNPHAYIRDNEALARALSASETFAIREGSDKSRVHVSGLREEPTATSVPSGSVSLALERLASGHWAVAPSNALRARLLRHVGRVGPYVQTIDGESFDATQLTAVPCSFPFGQCFAISGGPAR